MDMITGHWDISKRCTIIKCNNSKITISDRLYSQSTEIRDLLKIIYDNSKHPLLTKFGCATTPCLVETVDAFNKLKEMV